MKQWTFGGRYTCTHQIAPLFCLKGRHVLLRAGFLGSYRFLETPWHWPKYVAAFLYVLRCKQQTAVPLTKPES